MSEQFENILKFVRIFFLNQQNFEFWKSNDFKTIALLYSAFTKHF